MFHTPVLKIKHLKCFHEILNMFHTLEDDGSYALFETREMFHTLEQTHSNRVCRLKNEAYKH